MLKIKLLNKKEPFYVKKLEQEDYQLGIENNLLKMRYDLMK